MLQGDTFAERLGFPAVLDELLPRIVHCCWQDTWAARLGGAAGVRLLTFKLPASYLRYVSPQLVRALLTVSRFLPGEGHAGLCCHTVSCTCRRGALMLGVACMGRVLVRSAGDL